MKIIRAVTLLLSVGAFVACDDNPVAEDVDTVFRLELSHSFLTLPVNTDKSVAGYAVNRYGAPTFDAVTATACDGKVSIRPDSTMLPIEPPTRVMARGVSVGASCIVFSAASFTDTVRVQVQ